MANALIDYIKDNPQLWDLFTRKEEDGCEDLDQHRRYQHITSSCPDVYEPSVSRYLLENGLEVEYPDGRDFAIMLSHDVDQVCPTGPRTALSVVSSIRQGDLAECNRQLFWRLKGKEHSPFRTFKEIMDLEAKYDSHSTFFFLTKGPDSTKGGYPLKDVASDIVEISDRGWEIGLHGTYDAYLSKDEIARQKAALEDVVGKKIIGYRNHFLRFKAPETWRAVYEAGFSYDSTLGYVEHVGFRNGMCHPFQPYDLEAKEAIPLLEFPLALMDGTLYEGSKMGLSPEQGWETIERLMRTAKECHGTLVVLWHNMTFGNPAVKDWAKMYGKLLSKGKEEGAWLCSGEELYHWWVTSSHD